MYGWILSLYLTQTVNKQKYLFWYYMYMYHTSNVYFKKILFMIKKNTKNQGN